ncbi:MAG: MBL fold metallo-hydrolase, partial [Candidatus Gastranaerophilaceae bacterium]
DGSYAGCPAGILFEIEGIRIFHAGDTSLNSEMKVLKEVFNPEIAMLPIGGTYTMDIEQAAIAAEWIDAKTIIPIHYNTFEPINTDVQAFVKKVESQGKTVRVLSVGESL